MDDENPLPAWRVDADALLASLGQGLADLRAEGQDQKLIDDLQKIVNDVRGALRSSDARPD